MTYPRQCGDCEVIYNHQSSFSKHKARGTCANNALKKNVIMNIQESIMTPSATQKGVRGKAKDKEVKESESKGHNQEHADEENQEKADEEDQVVEADEEIQEKAQDEHYPIHKTTLIQSIDKPLMVHGTIEDPLFSANEIGHILGLSNIHMSLRNIDDKDKVLCNTITRGGNQQKMYLTKRGITILLQKSRKSNADSVAKNFGLDLYKTYLPPIEVNILENLRAVFTTEIIKHQYRVMGEGHSFFIDIYFPRWRIAVEVDEDHHRKTLHALKDKERESLIISKERCTFLRCSPSEEGFSIFRFIGDIYSLIDTKRKIPKSR